MVHIYYGNGKGKTTAALGLVLRALSYGFPVLMLKFLKNKGTSGEDRALKKFRNIRIVYAFSACPLFLNKKDKEGMKKIGEAQKQLFRTIPGYLKKDFRIIILDEVLDLIKLRLIRSQDLIGLFKSISPGKELICTGHYWDRDLVKAADLVTEMRNIKHYFKNKIKARKGIEF